LRNVTPVTFRDEARPEDPQNVRRIVRETGFFYPHEVEVAVELVGERLSRGASSGYSFLFAEDAGRLVGYTCFGPIACTRWSYDLFWIVVGKDRRGRGLGRDLLARTEEAIAAMGGRRVYTETSSRDLYAPTRGFYLKCGYRQDAILEDFYGPGDGKVIYVKELTGSPVAGEDA